MEECLRAQLLPSILLVLFFVCGISAAAAAAVPERTQANSSDSSLQLNIPSQRTLTGWQEPSSLHINSSRGSQRPNPRDMLKLFNWPPHLMFHSYKFGAQFWHFFVVFLPAARSAAHDSGYCFDVGLGNYTHFISMSLNFLPNFNINCPIFCPINFT